VYQLFYKIHEMLTEIQHYKGKGTQLTACRPKLTALDQYVEMMVVNRCIRPFSKLRTASWLDTTSYKVMHGYSQLERDVNYFYRSMDCLIDMKDAVELALFERLRNLFSVNVKLTFYDITSTFFYTENCPLGEHGYSRDHRRDCEQIVIGVVTSYEGYPLKHYVFKGDTTDVTTVKEVVKDLKHNYQIEDTVFVGDRGMVSKVNIEELEEHGFDCIMGVKMHHNELYQSVLLRDDLDWKEASLEHRGLKVLEKQVVIKNFLCWKLKRLLLENQIDRSDEEFDSIAEEIENLSNTTEPDFKGFRKLLRACWPNINSKLCQKIIAVLKRYKNHYDDQARFIICLNSERQRADNTKRQTAIKTCTTKLEQLFGCRNTKEEEANQQQHKKKTQAGTTPALDQPGEREQRIGKLFEGYRAKYRKFFQFQRDEATQHVTGYRLNQAVIDFEGKFDGVFALLSTRDELGAATVIDSYKNLQEVVLLGGNNHPV